MQQQNMFPVMNTTTEEQKQAAKDVAVICNILQHKVIEIEQANPRIKNIVGVMKCQYREMRSTEEEIMEAQGSIDQRQRYPSEVVGGSMVFVDNPFVRPPVPGGTGRVCFLLDDNEPLPPECMSGEKTGWNREFLASHWDDRLFIVVDDAIRAQIEKRAKAIARNVKAAMERADQFPAKPGLPSFAQAKVEPEDGDQGLGRVHEEPVLPMAEKAAEEVPQVGPSGPSATELALQEENAKLREQLAAAFATAANAKPEKKGRGWPKGKPRGKKTESGGFAS